MRLFALLFLLLSSVPVFAQAPGKPTNFSATAISAGDIRLNWTTPVGTPVPTGYYVYRALNPDGTFEVINGFGTLTGSSNTFTDNSEALVPGTTYKYQIRSFVGAQGAEILSEPSDVATATPIDSPENPLNLRASNITSTSITLTWDEVEGAASYILLREFEDDIEEFEVEEGTSYTDTGLTLNTTYIYTVIAVSSTGEESDESAPLSVTTFGDGTGKSAIWGRRFRQIDINADGLVTFEEYLIGHGGRLAWVIVKNRFDYTDTDETPGLNLAEYAKAFGGRKFPAPTKVRQFYLADQSGLLDGELDIEEYAKMRPARTKEAKLQKSFDKLNKEDTDGLTPDELKIRNYITPEEPEEPEEL